MPDLRLRILRLIEQREYMRDGRAAPTAGEIADALEEPLRPVSVTLRASEAIGLVELGQGIGTEERNVTVCLKPAAYIHLEANLNSG